MKAAEKDKDAAANDLDAVTGNAEDDIGETIAHIKEKELLYGEKSLLRKYGRMIAAICANPRRYRVCPQPVALPPQENPGADGPVTLASTGRNVGSHEIDVRFRTIL